MTAPFRSVLAATDLGDGSDAIVNSAARLAACTGAELHLLHSLDLPWIPSDDVVRRTGLRAQIAEAENRLREQVERAMPAGIRPMSQRVVLDSARRSVLQRGAEVSADLIVMGPHRRGALVADFLGTTADRVLRLADAPCLVLREPLPLPLHRIGVPIDCSDHAQGALQVALRWGLALRSEAETEVRVMHVGWTVEREDDPRMEDRFTRPALERQVEMANAQVPGADTLRTRVEVLWADDPRPAEATVAWASELHVDLLVMGTQGRSGLGRALIGSVASGVARRAPCAVLLVPPAR